MVKKSNKTIINNKKYFIHFFKPDNNKILDVYEFYDIKKINKIKTESVSNIFLYDLLGYIEQPNVLPLIKDIVGKLSIGGHLYIQDNDIKLLCSSYLSNQINTAIYKNIVYSKGKINCSTLCEIKDIMYNISCLDIIEIKFLNAFQYYIGCQKK
jgi:hypothetical protein